MKTEHKIILLSFIAGAALWMTDLIVDSLTCGPSNPLKASLANYISVPAFYRHSFIAVVFVVFGLLISRKVSEQKKLEGRLVRAKKELEETFNSIADSITIHDSEFNVIWANSTAESLLGISFSDSGGVKCYKCYHGTDSRPEECPSCETMRTGRSSVSQRYEPFLKKHLETRTLPRFGEGGKVTGVIHIVRDITYKKKLQTSLTESEERFRTLFNQATDCLLLMDPVHEGEPIIVDVNDTTCKLHGYTREELIGQPISFLDAHECRGQVPEMAREVMAGGKVIFEIRHVRKDGTTFPVEVAAQLISIGGKSYILATDRDISNRKFIEEELMRHREQLMELVEERTIELQRVNEILLGEIDGHRESKKREVALLTELKTIFENLPVGIIYLDRDYSVISTNRFFASLIRKAEGEIIGKPCYETVGEFARDPSKTGRQKICSYCKIESCLQSKRPVSVERPIGERIVSVTTIPEADENGDIVRFLNMIEDITDRRRAEAEAVRASHLAALGELAAGVAHEINNPVNGIINYSQILANRNEPGSSDHNIASRIIKEGDRIAGIVRALLSFARDRREDRHPVHLSDIMSDTLALTEAHLRKDGIRFISNIPGQLPMINAQPQQIEQVFLNIISNAQYALNEKFAGTHKNKVIEVAAGSVDIAGAPFVRITFRDAGTGIPVNILNKIMNPFFTTKPGNTGTGLGLSISYGIINNHGGKIQIDSVAGQFTSVIIDLPASQKSLKN